jgi:hypothetical protein
MGLLDRAKDTARRASEAAQRGADQAREKGQELALKRRHNALAQDLGHIVFRQREGEGGLDAEVERLVGEMRALRDEIEERGS